MKHAIYYFSGTGNSLYVARKLAERLDAQVISIASLDPGETGTHEIAGVVAPVYMHRVPHIVTRFLSAAPAAGYLYYVAVYGGDVGGVFTDVKRITGLRSQSLSAGFGVKMPSNYLPFGEAPTGDALDVMLADADGTIEDIAVAVGERTHGFPRQTSLFKRKIWPGLTFAMGYRFINFLDKNFRADDRCNGCGICARLCPVNNIEMAEGSPRWLNHCEQCLGCLNLCPQEAIQYGKKTEGLRRYRNPGIRLSDLNSGSG